MPDLLKVISAEGERNGERDFISSLAPSNWSKYSKLKQKSSFDTAELLRDPFNRDTSKFTVRSGAIVSESEPSKNPSSFDLDDLILNRKEKDKKNEGE